jgi:tetratricopeptide (TPR) repeat protein
MRTKPSYFAVLTVLLVAGSASAESNRARADRHHEQAAAFYRVEAYEDAIAEWKQSYALVPNPSRLFNIGRAFEELGDPERAVEFYERYVKEDPNGQAVAEANARIRQLSRDVERARAERERLEALTAARARIGERDYDAAIDAYQRAYEASGDPAIVYEIAQAHRLAGSYAAAIGEYDRYMELAPDGERAADALAHRQTLAAALEADGPDGGAGGEAGGAAAEIRRGQPRSTGGWSGMRIGGVSTLGVAALSAGGGVVFALQARSAQRAVEGAQGAWSAELDDRVAKGEAAERNVIIATVVSGAALVAGGALLYLDARSGSAASAGSLSIAPSLTGSSAGLVLGGRF